MHNKQNKKLAKKLAGDGTFPHYMQTALDRVNARGVKAFPNHFPPVLRSRIMVWRENGGEPYKMQVIPRHIRRNEARKNKELHAWKDLRNTIVVGATGGPMQKQVEQNYVPYPLRTVVQGGVDV